MRTLRNILLALVSIFTLAACSVGSDAVSDQIDTAREAIAADDFAGAQTIIDNLVKNGLDNMTEVNLGRLAIIYMQLSDHDRYEENVAAATECMRQALKVSQDSLAGFSSTLTPDEEVHFTLVRRITGGIDNPIDLMKADIADEDGVDSLMIHQ